MSRKVQIGLRAVLSFILLCGVVFVSTWMGLSIAHNRSPMEEIKSWGQQENAQIEDEKNPDSGSEEIEVQNVEDIEDYSDLTIVA